MLPLNQLSVQITEVSDFSKMMKLGGAQIVSLSNPTTYCMSILLLLLISSSAAAELGPEWTTESCALLSVITRSKVQVRNYESPTYLPVLYCSVAPQGEEEDDCHVCWMTYLHSSTARMSFLYGHEVSSSINGRVHSPLVSGQRHDFIDCVMSFIRLKTSLVSVPVLLSQW